MPMLPTALAFPDARTKDTRVQDRRNLDLRTAPSQLKQVVKNKGLPRDERQAARAQLRSLKRQMRSRGNLRPGALADQSGLGGARHAPEIFVNDPFDDEFGYYANFNNIGDAVAEELFGAY